MQPNLSTIRVSIIDFLGVLLPGSVWAILLLSLAGFLGCGELPRDGSPVSVAMQLGTASYTVAAYSAFVGAAFVIGFVVNALASITAEPITLTLPILFKLYAQNRRMKKSEAYGFRDYLFPYRARHKSKTYFDTIQMLVKRATCCDADELPARQPFSSCKRLLRLYAPPLWEEAEYMEAQSRMLGSMVLASVFWVALSVAALKNSEWTTVVGALVVTIVVMVAYGRRRA
ncbi:MAG: hypothetical protein IH987_14920 [Planctomycetes bacterium]|nr:hypothetical protein [Planctomycetota bacterium]